MYVDRNGGKDILAHYKQNDSLDKTMRRKLITIVVALVVEKFGYFPSKEQKISVALATVNCFECLKVADSQHGGIVCFMLIALTRHTQENLAY